MTAAIDRAAFLSERADAAMLRLEDSIERLQESRLRLRAMRQEIHAGRSRRAQLHDSAFGRLQARLDTMPVIEQAKGILMGQTGCRAEQAFDMLRRASQRSNVPVRDIAAQIVDRTYRGGVGPAPDPGPSPPVPAATGRRPL